MTVILSREDGEESQPSQPEILRRAAPAQNDGGEIDTKIHSAEFWRPKIRIRGKSWKNWMNCRLNLTRVCPYDWANSSDNYVFNSTNIQGR
jgi:hypothetical protein